MTVHPAHESRRSSHWHAMEVGFLHVNGSCAGCGTTEHLQVHHIVPFHVRPDLELVWSNLITLCMGPRACHFNLGHHRNWDGVNPNVVADAAAQLKSIKGVGHG